MLPTIYSLLTLISLAVVTWLHLREEREELRDDMRERARDRVHARRMRDARRGTKGGRR